MIGPELERLVDLPLVAAGDNRPAAEVTADPQQGERRPTADPGDQDLMSRLQQPAPAGSLGTPADKFLLPSDIDIFLMGRLEDPRSGIGLMGASAGGIDGSFGHIIK